MPRYALLQTDLHHLYLIKDDGYRFMYQCIESDSQPELINKDWELVMEYKQCAIVDVGSTLADILMRSLGAATIPLEFPK